MTFNVDRPLVVVKALPEGKGSQTLDFGERLLKFEYVDEEKAADKCTLVLDNFDLFYFDDPTFRKGTILEVTFGYAGRMSPIRRTIVHKVKGGRVLTIEAHGMAMVMHKVKRSRTWESKTLAQIATEIAASYGADFNVVGGTSAGNIKVEAIYDQPRTRHQASETDASFLSRLSRRHGLEFYVDSQGLHFKPRNLAQAPIKEFVWYNGDGEFLDFSIDNDIACKPGSVTKKGIDPLTKRVLSHTAENGTGKRDGLAPVIEIVDPKTGKLTLQSRTEVHTEHSSEVTDGGIKSHAEAKFRGAQHETIHLNTELIGDPDVLAKRVYIFSGLGKRISGRYYLKQATHTIEHGKVYRTGTKGKTDGHGGYANNNAGSKAALNKKAAADEQIEIVDARTGGSHIEFRKRSEEKK